ncbi:MAG: hypothetical protein NTX25_12330 [Proteobacteria bacterium]|nr:hypothetical protein [Pseudomonadota bacterium]
MNSYTKLCRVLLLLGLFFFSSLSTAQGKIRIVVSVDWEGRDLQQSNLKAMNAFRQDYPFIPLQHFLNAAYYNKSGAQASELTAAIQSVLRPGDEHGLHIHAWKSLVEAAGVPFRRTPSFVKEDVDLQRCGLDCGNDVALTAYSYSELRQLIKFSLDSLESHGFHRAKSFRAGGWQADDTVLSALAAEGITLDSSATYAPYLYTSWGPPYHLYDFVAALWPAIRPSSQPYRLNLSNGMSIIEVPNNGCLADYRTGEEFFASFLTQVKIWKENPARDVYLSIGFHEETAQSYLPRLRLGIDKILAYANLNQISYEFVVAPF